MLGRLRELVEKGRLNAVVTLQHTSLCKSHQQMWFCVEEGEPFQWARLVRTSHCRGLGVMYKVFWHLVERIHLFFSSTLPSFLQTFLWPLLFVMQLLSFCF